MNDAELANEMRLLAVYFKMNIQHGAARSARLAAARIEAAAGVVEACERLLSQATDAGRVYAGGVETHYSYVLTQDVESLRGAIAKYKGAAS